LLPAQRAAFDADERGSAHFSTTYGLTLPLLDVDHDLDAVVCRSRCDIFGMPRDGFFLVPPCSGSGHFRNLWQASDALDAGIRRWT
jgi:hypothetical protein